MSPILNVPVAISVPPGLEGQQTLGEPENVVLLVVAGPCIEGWTGDLASINDTRHINAIWAIPLLSHLGLVERFRQTYPTLPEGRLDAEIGHVGS